jgi:H+-translocating NAD(P) transhydrogenase subunit alpha
MAYPSKVGLWGARVCTVLLLCLTLGALWASAAGGTALRAEARTANEAVADAPQADAHATGAADSTTAALIASLYILILTGFVGFEVIGGVSPLLHTPLMSATNAISAISVVGALVIAGGIHYSDLLSRLLGFAAVTAAMINVVGGFMITDRMLRMFKPKEARR